jgi:hypothetical protein
MFGEMFGHENLSKNQQNWRRDRKHASERQWCASMDAPSYPNLEILFGGGTRPLEIALWVILCVWFTPRESLNNSPEVFMASALHGALGRH